MCGRYSLTTPPEAMYQLFGLKELVNLAPRYNIAPSQSVPVVRIGDAGREMAMMRWGLIPSWSKDTSFAAKTINARAETVAEKPSFRKAFKSSRCLIPADGYYEWVKGPDGKQPWLFQRADKGVMAFAGLWDRWVSTEDGEVVDSCSIIVRSAGEFTQALHHRMPVITPPDQFSTWLGEGANDMEAVQRIMDDATDEGMTVHAVSKLVNAPRNDVPACLEPIELSGELPDELLASGNNDTPDADEGGEDEPPAQGSLF
ncbi:MAG: SOS response-associated peptidase [Alphaproteobacteria bacterium]|jgi:putative SOS response-associated peptidase YedK|nr:SOS response-associated peptidase [Alphaproteobacteria bacterium]MBT4020549.1 SOS response-associated peptidase [Alphaproteobacteria bacterium]MBT4965503.1 SOS response-associated peptidase [Alphaproteobacteria bacterium]MBT5160533.1 SOS response-associated peptidase [Alphaproteobacteria bacterium]MBT6384905.1 SOS response-associated peptidase [Alphaproteobacteria bacterium]